MIQPRGDLYESASVFRIKNFVRNLPPKTGSRDALRAWLANGEMHTARFGFLSKTEAAVRRIGPLRRTEALLAFAPLN